MTRIDMWEPPFSELTQDYSILPTCQPRGPGDPGIFSEYPTVHPPEAPLTFQQAPPPKGPASLVAGSAHFGATHPTPLCAFIVSDPAKLP